MGFVVVLGVQCCVFHVYRKISLIVDHIIMATSVRAGDQYREEQIPVY